MLVEKDIFQAIFRQFEAVKKLDVLTKFHANQIKNNEDRGQI